MLVVDVLVKYQEKVPFPWTIRKIKRAGFVPSQLFMELGRELSQCDDAAGPLCCKVLTAIEKLKET